MGQLNARRLNIRSYFIIIIIICFSLHSLRSYILQFHAVRYANGNVHYINYELFTTNTHSLPTLTMSVGVGKMIGFVCLSVCLLVCLSCSIMHNSETNDPKVFELGIWNDHGMLYE